MLQSVAISWWNPSSPYLAELRRVPTELRRAFSQTRASLSEAETCADPIQIHPSGFQRSVLAHSTAFSHVEIAAGMQLPLIPSR
ncbi:MAG: hypothetical protein ACQETE_09770 [Bacteroidota bacterium]